MLQITSKIFFNCCLVYISYLLSKFYENTPITLSYPADKQTVAKTTVKSGKGKD